MSVHTPLDELSLVDRTAIDDPVCREQGLVFTADVWDKLDHQFKRRLAATAASDNINGKSNALELREFFVCQRSLGEFEQ